MKTGKVIKICENYIVVLTDSAAYIRLKKREVAIGKEIFFFKEDVLSTKINSSIIRYVAIASVVFLLLLAIPRTLLAPSNPNTTSTSYAAVISVDINPSFELMLNQDYYVQMVVPLNDEARGLNLTDKIVHKYYTLAVKDIITAAKEKGYMIKNNTVMVSASTIDANDLSTISDNVKNAFAYDNQYDLLMLEANQEDYDASKANNTSLGKYVVYKEQMATNSGVPLDRVKEMPVTKLLEENVIPEEKKALIQKATPDQDSRPENTQEMLTFMTKDGVEYINSNSLKILGITIESHDPDGTYTLLYNNNTKSFNSEYFAIIKNGILYLELKSICEIFDMAFTYVGYNFQVTVNNKAYLLYYEDYHTSRKTPVTKKTVTTPSFPKVVKNADANTDVSEDIASNYPTSKDKKSEVSQSTAKIEGITNSSPPLLSLNGYELISSTLLTDLGITLSITKDGIYVKMGDMDHTSSSKQYTYYSQAYYDMKDILSGLNIPYSYKDKQWVITHQNKQIKLTPTNIKSN